PGTPGPRGGAGWRGPPGPPRPGWRAPPGAATRGAARGPRPTPIPRAARRTLRPRTRRAGPPSPPWLSDLTVENRRGPLPEADAHGGQPVAHVALFHLVEQRGEQPAARRAEGVTRRARPAVHVGPIERSAQLLGPGERHAGERLVDLEQADVPERQPGAGEHLAGR